jgi:hypothetical protein
VSHPRKPFAVHVLLIALVAATPVLALSPGALGPQFVTLVTAIMLALLPSAPDVDIQRSIAVFRPLVPAAMLPAAWMLLQIVPVPSASIAHPIWRSAAAALAGGVPGHISIDLGFTLRALFGYLSLAGLAFATAVVARNRDRAETLRVSVGDVFNALSSYLGATYVNEFYKYGQVFQVYVQADSKYRLRPDDLLNL